MKHKVFISYHHRNDQLYKDLLIQKNIENEIFIDSSVDTGEISDSLTDEEIRVKIRDEYLIDSSVTILLAGTETKARKHIDWEIYSSMYDGKVNKKSGILVINLPSTNCKYFTAAHENEQKIYPADFTWTNIQTRKEYEERYPYLPDRIIDNLISKKSKISITNWDTIYNNPTALKFLIDATFNDRSQAEYDLSRPMRRKDG